MRDEGTENPERGTENTESTVCLVPIDLDQVRLSKVRREARCIYAGKFQFQFPLFSSHFRETDLIQVYLVPGAPDDPDIYITYSIAVTRQAQSGKGVCGTIPFHDPLCTLLAYLNPSYKPKYNKRLGTIRQPERGTENPKRVLLPFLYFGGGGNSERKSRHFLFARQ